MPAHPAYCGGCSVRMLMAARMKTKIEKIANRMMPRATGSFAPNFSASAEAFAKSAGRWLDSPGRVAARSASGIGCVAPVTPEW